MARSLRRPIAYDNPDTCNGAGSCQTNHKGGPCDLDNLFCTADVCDGGVCTPGGNPCGGAEPICCEATGMCEDECCDDSDCPDPDFCDGVDLCLDGVCVSPGIDPCETGGACENCCNEEADGCFCGSGTLCGDQSSTDCTNSDSCNGAGTCDANHASPGDPCGDQGVVCLVDDTCDGSGECTDNGPEPDGTPCPDGLFCNGSETCLGGTCTSGEPPCVDCDESGDGCPTSALLDIRPGSCPNPVNDRSKGVLPVAILGSEDFDVALIDLTSLELRRADGFGDPVAPLEGDREPGFSIHDVSASVSDESCECHTLGADGIDDLVMKFSVSDLAAAFDLDNTGSDSPVIVTVSGMLFDGTIFSASDCLRIVPNARGQGGRP